jgi:hypothetical protein
LRDNVDESRLAALDHFDRTAEGWAKLSWIGNRTLTVNTHASCDRREVDVWIFDPGADAGIGDAALMSIGHALDVHDLLMVGAIVVHHAQ